MKKKITKILSNFISDINYESIPNKTRNHIKMCFLDTVGCMLYGYSTRAGIILRKTASHMKTPAGATIIGEKFCVSPPLACFINGSFAGVMAFDDLHHKATVHCGCVAIPAALAAIDVSDGPVTGKEFLTSIVTGYEVMIRVALSLMPSIRIRGYHPASVVGGFCGAAVASKIFRLSNTKIMNALGIGGGWCSGLMSAQHGSMIHGMQAPNSGMQGVFSALLAKEGIIGTSKIFEEGYGSLPSAVTNTFRPEFITEELGKRFESGETGIKYYPTAGSVSSTLDALKIILDEHLIDAKDIQEVLVRVNKAVYLHCGFNYRQKYASEAQMSIKYCVAAFLEFGQVTASEFEYIRIRDERIKKRMKAIIVLHDPTMDNQGIDKNYFVKVTVKTVSGNKYQSEVVFPKGSAENPLNLEEVIKKFKHQAAETLSGEEMDILVERLLTCEKIKCMKGLTKNLSSLNFKMMPT